MFGKNVVVFVMVVSLIIGGVKSAVLLEDMLRLVLGVLEDTLLEVLVFYWGDSKEALLDKELIGPNILLLLKGKALLFWKLLFEGGWITVVVDVFVIEITFPARGLIGEIGAWGIDVVVFEGSCNSPLVVFWEKIKGLFWAGFTKLGFCKLKLLWLLLGSPIMPFGVCGLKIVVVVVVVWFTIPELFVVLFIKGTKGVGIVVVVVVELWFVSGAVGMIIGDTVLIGGKTVCWIELKY